MKIHVEVTLEVLGEGEAAEDNARDIVFAVLCAAGLQAFVTNATRFLPSLV